MGFFRSLISSQDAEVDSIIVAGCISMLIMCGLTIYCAVLDHTTFSPLTFSTGAATIIAAIGTGKGIRDRLSPQQGPQ